jgi:hypothetical protein
MRAIERLLAAVLLLGSTAAALSLPHLLGGHPDAGLTGVSTPPRVASSVVVVSEPSVLSDPRSPAEARQIVVRARAAAHLRPLSSGTTPRLVTAPARYGGDAQDQSLAGVHVSAPMPAAPASRAAQRRSLSPQTRTAAPAAPSTPSANRVLATDRRHSGLPALDRHGPGAPKDDAPAAPAAQPAPSQGAPNDDAHGHGQTHAHG